ncbi:Response regulator receiver domain-containing protein [Hydrobacter penzbergensis]|uniref:Response regulator receiver domain-containing protein n=1 Tax=Hydrobacter penzbergensis TaxID=1235997 RepID=A0A8X8IEI5_9BACT|nr:response regulator [Hydrobacter penzbergensis]SDX35285.1 Response regulator receiver domain-containing protein [Hydrobacter penzbergensis]
MKYTVCLIDDDPIYQFTARKILESTDLVKEVHSFNNGAEALVHFEKLAGAGKKDFPDIIFLDINMPVLDGWEFLTSYEKMQLPVVSPPLYMVSSSINEADIQHSATFHTVTGYLVKPVPKTRYRELLEALGNGH